MRFQYSTRPPLNPVYQPLIPRFYVHVMDVYESPGHASAHCYDDLKSPADTAPQPPLFIRCFARSLLVRKDTPTPQQLRKLASAPRNPQVRSIGGK